ncbi:hypothetical protein JCM1840_003137 [Sporobolomyces johnsonii]
MLRAASVSLFAAAVLVASVSAQTAADIETELSTLSTVIPGACDTDCSTWLTSYAACGTDSTSTTFSTCVCDATFQSNFATCSSCMSTELTTEGDTTNAATATQAPTDLTDYCATAASSTTTSSVLTTSSTTTTTSATSTTATPVTTSTSSSSSSSSSSTSTTDSASSSTASSATSTTAQSTTDGDFPTQTKSASVFANAGAKVEGKVVAVAAGLLGAVAGAMVML